MSNLDIGLLVVLLSQIAFLATSKPSRTRDYLLPAAFFLSIGLATILLCFSQTTNENILVQLLSGRRLQSRSDLATFAFAITCGFLLGWLMGLVVRDKRWVRIVGTAALYFLFASSVCLLASKEILSRYLANPGSSGSNGLLVKESASGWSVRKVTDLSVSPTSMALLDNGDILVAGYSGGYFQTGGVIKVVVGSEGVRQSFVASGMTRPHGIAVRNGKIYVSRAGQYSRAVGGRLVQMNTGCITEFQDLDADGIYEFAEDIVAELPGAQLPDGLHQNNNIAFTQEGKLLVTVGTPTDHAPPVGPIDGVILEVDVPKKDYSIYASGFRNPFGIAISEEGRVFCTDNDSNDTNFGDRLIELKKGADYGHPYTSAKGVEVSGAEAIFARVPSGQGIAFYPRSGNQTMRGKLLLACYGDDSVGVVDPTLASTTGSQNSKVSFLAKVPGPVAVCCTDDGVIYACSYKEKSLYEIRYNP